MSTKARCRILVASAIGSLALLGARRPSGAADYFERSEAMNQMKQALDEVIAGAGRECGGLVLKRLTEGQRYLEIAAQDLEKTSNDDWWRETPRWKFRSDPQASDNMMVFQLERQPESCFSEGDYAGISMSWDPANKDGFLRVELGGRHTPRDGLDDSASKNPVMSDGTNAKCRGRLLYVRVDGGKTAVLSRQPNAPDRKYEYLVVPAGEKSAPPQHVLRYYPSKAAVGNTIYRGDIGQIDESLAAATSRARPRKLHARTGAPTFTPAYLVSRIVDVGRRLRDARASRRE